MRAYLVPARHTVLGSAAKEPSFGAGSTTRVEIFVIVLGPSWLSNDGAKKRLPTNDIHRPSLKRQFIISSSMWPHSAGRLVRLGNQNLTSTSLDRDPSPQIVSR